MEAGRTDGADGRTARTDERVRAEEEEEEAGEGEDGWLGKTRCDCSMVGRMDRGAVDLSLDGDDFKIGIRTRIPPELGITFILPYEYVHV